MSQEVRKTFPVRSSSSHRQVLRQVRDRRLRRCIRYRCPVFRPHPNSFGPPLRSSEPSYCPTPSTPSPSSSTRSPRVVVVRPILVRLLRRGYSLRRDPKTRTFGDRVRLLDGAGQFGVGIWVLCSVVSRTGHQRSDRTGEASQSRCQRVHADLDLDDSLQESQASTGIHQWYHSRTSEASPVFFMSLYRVRIASGTSSTPGPLPKASWTRVRPRVVATDRSLLVRFRCRTTQIRDLGQLLS